MVADFGIVTRIVGPREEVRPLHVDAQLRDAGFAGPLVGEGVAQREVLQAQVGAVLDGESRGAGGGIARQLAVWTVHLAVGEALQRVPCHVLAHGIAHQVAAFEVQDLVAIDALKIGRHVEALP